MSIAGGLYMAIGRACSINCTAAQMFVKNNMQSCQSGSDLDAKDNAPLASLLTSRDGARDPPHLISRMVNG
jgi:hypothetical protein